MIKYELAHDIKQKIIEIARKVQMEHIELDNLVCVRSKGSGARGTIARCHALPRVWQKGLGINAKYIIEVITERFDKMPEEEKIKTLIHELMHIPKAFGGGFIHHSQFSQKDINRIYNQFLKSEKI
ncbi:metallopeptidase [Candidatus Pacearchaeota archaeon]|nr:metallopeptidase [Candidatus Pacearchaeota archaeon]